MRRKTIGGACLVLLFSACVPVSAIDFSSARQLAGYEPEEVNNLIVRPGPQDSTLAVTWPLEGKTNGAPEATDGNYILKMQWTNEDDPCKVEIRHDWINSFFDLPDGGYIHLDVYLATESAEANIIGLWDINWDNNWIATECIPAKMRTNEWRTISFGMQTNTQSDVNRIEATVFEQMRGPYGTIFLDNLRLGANQCNCLRKIKFGRYWWSVEQSDWQKGAGPNCYTDEPDDVFVDANGFLHMSIVYKDPNWYCSEVITNESFGYGTYVYTVEGDTNLLDPNIVVGLFIFEANDENEPPREIDVELTKWGKPSDPNNAQYVIQPWRNLGNEYRYRIEYEHPNDVVTHVIKWKPQRVEFCSYRGPYISQPQGKDILDCWSYGGADIPEPNHENPRINFYLMNGDAPQEAKNAHLIIRDFRYIPLGDIDDDEDVDFVDFALFAEKWLIGK